MKLFKSRTFWTLVLTFALAGVEGIRESFSPEVFTFIMAGLLALASYFKANPSQEY